MFFASNFLPPPLMCSRRGQLLSRVRVVCTPASARPRQRFHAAPVTPLMWGLWSGPPCMWPAPTPCAPLPHAAGAAQGPQRPAAPVTAFESAPRSVRTPTYCRLSRTQRRPHFSDAHGSERWSKYRPKVDPAVMPRTASRPHDQSPTITPSQSSTRTATDGKVQLRALPGCTVRRQRRAADSWPSRQLQQLSAAAEAPSSVAVTVTVPSHCADSSHSTVGAEIKHKTRAANYQQPMRNVNRSRSPRNALAVSRQPSQILFSFGE
jgi:hypothetical protein